jgi:hypothetical protein
MNNKIKHINFVDIVDFALATHYLQIMEHSNRGINK